MKLNKQMEGCFVFVLFSFPIPKNRECPPTRENVEWQTETENLFPQTATPARDNWTTNIILSVIRQFQRHIGNNSICNCS